MDTAALRISRVARRAIADCGGAALVEQALVGEPARAERWLVVGAGKAAGAMARGAVRALGDRAHLGPLVTRAPEPRLPDGVRAALLLGGHPLPDDNSVRAADRLLHAVAFEEPSLPVLFLLSGGASALLGAPIDGLPLDELRRVTQALLASGHPIGAINAVRRHLGRAAGGRVALAARGRRLLALAISDVVGDDPAAIGSGPVSGDPSTFAEALRVLRAAGAGGGPAERVLLDGASGLLEETPRPADPRLSAVEYRVLAGPATLLARARVRAIEEGLDPLVIEEPVEGEVSALASRYLGLAPSLRPGQVLLAVGEPTLRLAAQHGLGGRAQQLALEVARGLAEREGRSAGAGDLRFLALGSDGSDGPTDVAGALVDATTRARAAAAGWDVSEALARNDAYPLLSSIGAHLATGPTGTNVLDLHLLARAPMLP